MTPLSPLNRAAEVSEGRTLTTEPGGSSSAQTCPGEIYLEPSEDPFSIEMLGGRGVSSSRCSRDDAADWQATGRYSTKMVRERVDVCADIPSPFRIVDER